MKKHAFAATLIALVSFNSHADESSNWSAGIGLYEFGGHLGVKYAYDLDPQNSVTVAVGTIGYALGYERKINENIIAGFNVGAQVAVAEDGYAVAKVNYYFDGVEQSSWFVGASLGAKEDDGDCFVFCPEKDTNKVEPTFGIHLGYAF
jgi:hypothetical protein